MRSALKLSAFSGVDVRIIIPSKVDHISAYFGTRGNVEELLEAGVKIYSYNKGFIHAKSWIVDDELASIGTANFDVRSLYVNFEVNSVIYDKSVVKQLEKQFLVDFSHCDELEYDIWKKRGVFRRFFEGVIKLLSPLL